MFKRLRTRLTVVCTIITGIILIGMACGSLYISERELARRGQSSFASDVNATLLHIGSQNILDHAWLSQSETNGGLMFYLEDGGKPLLFSGSKDVTFLEISGLQDSNFLLMEGSPQAERKTLFMQAREIALQEHALDISKPPETRLRPETVLFSISDHLGVDYYAAASVVPLNDGWIGLILLKSTYGEHLQVIQLRWMFAGLVALAIFLLGIFAWLFTARAIRPVEESRKKQMEFVSAASHELRSPLAVIQTSIEAMEHAPPEQANRFSKTITGECQRMSRLVGDMLTLAGADNHTWSMRWEELEPETLLLNTAERFEPIAARKNISIFVSLPDEPLPKCRCDGQRIGQVLSVLLDNAVSYTDTGGRISLSITQNHRFLRFMVADNGVGIADADKMRIFERFYRSDPARSSREHYGLGLCIAREIAELHKGQLTVQDAPDGGAAFILTIPFKQPN